MNGYSKSLDEEWNVKEKEKLELVEVMTADFELKNTMTRKLIKRNHLNNWGFFQNGISFILSRIAIQKLL